ncbi:MAG TPA: BTAD domain-containing putative transcriptional regulator [Solirubrobacterales bacterium]|jgi:DNA-binding SARP family transcriptional activator
MTRTPGALDERSDRVGRTIARPKLAARINGALQSGNVILTAGAGFGKTTILEQALADRSTPVAWISCTDRERGPGILVNEIIDTISRAVPGTTDAMAERLATGIEPIDPPAAMRELIAELSGLLVEPLVLVIDDAEHLDGADRSLRLVAQMMRAQVPRLHLAVSTRRSLGLRVAKLRAGGLLLELSARDLVFEATECEQALALRTSVDPSPLQVEAVMQATEGWPLGVGLVAAQGAHAVGAENASQPISLSSTPEVRSYLSEEILDSLEPELRAGAIDASVPRRVSPEVAEALGLPEDFPERLERAGMLIRRHGGGDGFSYHPLLREFLGDQARAELAPGELRRLHATVAPAVAAGGDRISAIEHWLEAESWVEAVDCIQRDGRLLVKANPALLRGWIARLPEQFAERPAIRALVGQMDWLAGDNANAITELQAAVRGFREQPNPPADWLARSVLADALFATGRVNELDEVVRGWDDPAAEGAGALAPATVAYAAVVFAAYARPEESDQLASGARAHPGAAFLEPLEALRLAFRDAPRGELDPIIERLEAADRDMERFDPLTRRAHVLGMTAGITCERGHPERALRLWQTIREMSGGGVLPGLLDATHTWCAVLHAQAGRLAEAEAELSLYRGRETGYWNFVVNLAPVVIASLRGDAVETVAAAERALASMEDGPISFQCWVAGDLVPPLVAVGHPGRAGEAIEWGLEQLNRELPGPMGMLPRSRLLGLRAWLRHLDGDPRGSDADLRECFTEAGDAVRFTLRREWSRLEPLIWDALERETLDPELVFEQISRALPEGVQLVPFLDHPNPAARRAALEPAVRSGDPDAVGKLRRLADEPDSEFAPAASNALDRLARSMPALGFEVLGGFAVRRGSWRATESDWARPIDARLVRFLLVNGGQPIPEDLIFEALWPGRDANGARRSLQVAVSRARQVLDAPGSDGSVIESGGQSYRLAIEDEHQVDANRFSAAAEAALASEGEERLPLLERAHSLWPGEPLPEERYAEWATSYRERLIDQYIAVLTGLIQLHERSGEHARSADIARELVDLDQLNEEGHRALMTAYARTGRRGHALRQYLECRRALVDALGVEPAEETSRLQARILAGEPL